MGSLDGFTIVDCTSAIAGPMCAGQLADHGARVIRVEGPEKHGEREPTAYAVWNRGKESVLLDLEDERGRDVFRRLLEVADALGEDWPAKFADTRGLSWAELHARFPRLVVCTISGYGLGSPHAGRPAEEALVLARLGIMAEQAGIGPGAPHFLGATRDGRAPACVGWAAHGRQEAAREQR